MLVPNRPTPEGQALGAELARLTDVAERHTLQQFPKHRERCQSCAFRAGTIPNGCPETVMDALKCVVEGKPFYCHQAFADDGSPVDLCAGWVMTQDGARIPPIKTSWPFSTEAR